MVINLLYTYLLSESVITGQGRPTFARPSKLYMYTSWCPPTSFGVSVFGDSVGVYLCGVSFIKRISMANFNSIGMVLCMVISVKLAITDGREVLVGIPGG